jgi:cell division control protein 7
MTGIIRRFSAHSSNPFKVHSSGDPIAGFDEDEDQSPKRPTSRIQCKLQIIEDGDEDELDFISPESSSKRRSVMMPPPPVPKAVKEVEYEESEENIEDNEQVPDPYANAFAEEDEEMPEYNSDSEQAYSEIDPEENTLAQRPVEEQEQIESEIFQLIEDVPGIDEEYRLLDRLGTGKWSSCIIRLSILTMCAGTFSSVYKAVDLKHHEMDNKAWQGSNHQLQSSSPDRQRPPGSKVYVAIKRIYATSSPQRIENEIQLLETLRGCRHISQIITAFRHKDQVVVVMPYQRNVDFREFYRELPWNKIREYFRSLFRALRDVHARGIIHRDVKPANFLFDPETATGTLCDFGLAQSFDEADPDSFLCYHTPPSDEHPHGRINPELPLPLQRQLRDAKIDVKKRREWPSDRIGYMDQDPRSESAPIRCVLLK